jgi:enamine deaminase RidA (YjgF/YER057c/UK114 family)
MSLTQRLADLKLQLPSLSGPFGSYIPAKRAAGLIFVSGQLPMKEGKLLASGQVPSQCSIAQAQEGARQCVLNALAAVATLGADALEKLTGVVKVSAFISSDGSFTQQPQVANAASDLLVELFGPAGQHPRAALAAPTLPLNAAVEIEFIFETR